MKYTNDITENVPVIMMRFTLYNLYIFNHAVIKLLAVVFYVCYSCQCKDGFTGEACDVNIDECASNPCKFGAKCEDLIAGYKCHCPSGKTGEDCSTGVLV